MVFLRTILVLIATFLGTNPSQASSPRHLYFGCEIYDVQNTKLPKLLRKFPGELCLFQNDGSVVLIELNSVVKYSSSMQRLWSFSTRAHHQLNASIDGKSILVIGSESIPFSPLKGNSRPELVRADVLFVLGQDGKLLKKFSYFDNRTQFRKAQWEAAVARRSASAWRIQTFKDVDWEITHTNSFYEIGMNDAEKARPEFKRGHYIVNDFSLRQAFVLDSDLKKVVWQKSLNPAPSHMIHDVQVLPEGHLLFYDNGTNESPKSQLVELDLKTDKIVWTHRGLSGQPFYSPLLGGVQKLSPSGGYLYTDITKGRRIIEIDKNENEVWSWRIGDRKYLQQARLQDLTEFLKKNQAL